MQSNGNIPYSNKHLVLKKTTKGNKKRHHILGLFRIFATRNNILSNSSTGYYHLFQKNCLLLQLKHSKNKRYSPQVNLGNSIGKANMRYPSLKTSVWTIAYSIAKAFLGPTS